MSNDLQKVCNDYGQDCLRDLRDSMALALEGHAETFECVYCQELIADVRKVLKEEEE